MAKAEQAVSVETAKPKPRFETLRAVFWAALIALAIRSFVIEPFKIPSGSMIPTLLVGDYVLVNKFAYGLRLPFTGTLLVPIGTPKRGDVIVFRFPDDPHEDYIKRVIGLPGDRIEVRDKRVYINGTLVERTPDGEFVQPPGDIGGPALAQRFIETNPEGVQYTILQAMPEAPPPPRPVPAGPWIVPEGHYFMMGDNRDNSADSRYWTQHFVSPEAIKGKAFMIHWSWVINAGDRAPRSFIGDLLFTLSRVLTLQVEKIRWSRMGHAVAGEADKTPPPTTQ